MKKIDESVQEYAIKKRMKVLVVSEFDNLFNKSKLMSNTISSWSKFNRRERQICKVNRIGKEEKHWKIESDVNEKNFENLKEEAKKREQIIIELEEKIQKFEEMKLDYIESEEKLAKLYAFDVIDSLGEPISLLPDAPTDMKF